MAISITPMTYLRWRQQLLICLVVSKWVVSFRGHCETPKKGFYGCGIAAQVLLGQRCHSHRSHQHQRSQASSLAVSVRVVTVSFITVVSVVCAYPR